MVVVAGPARTEYGLRSFQTMHDWAQWALDQIDQATTAIPETKPTDKPHR